MDTTTEEEARDAAIAGALAVRHHTEFGVVKQFNAASGTAGPTCTVQPSVRFRKRVNGTPETYPAPTLSKVPVLYSRTTFPLAVGDEVMIVFADRGYDNAYLNGGTGNEPNGTRRDSLSDAFCVPLAWSSGVSAALTHTAATMVVNVPEATLNIGESATLAAARVTDDVDANASMITWAGHVNAQLVALGGTAVPFPTTFGDISSGSSKVNIE